jgi:hypothetical protein
VSNSRRTEKTHCIDDLIMDRAAFCAKLSAPKLNYFPVLSN